MTKTNKKLILTDCIAYDSLYLDESDDEESTQSEDDDIVLNAQIEDNVTNPKRKRACKEILTPRLAAVLDKLKLSSRDTGHILIAVLDAVGLSSSEFIINRHSIRQQRVSLRKQKAQTLYQRLKKTLNH